MIINEDKSQLTLSLTWLKTYDLQWFILFFWGTIPALICTIPTLIIILMQRLMQSRSSDKVKIQPRFVCLFVFLIHTPTRPHVRAWGVSTVVFHVTCTRHKQDNDAYVSLFVSRLIISFLSKSSSEDFLLMWFSFSFCGQRSSSHRVRIIESFVRISRCAIIISWFV